MLGIFNFKFPLNSLMARTCISTEYISSDVLFQDGKRDDALAKLLDRAPIGLKRRRLRAG